MLYDKLQVGFHVKHHFIKCSSFKISIGFTRISHYSMYVMMSNGNMSHNTPKVVVVGRPVTAAGGGSHNGCRIPLQTHNNV